MTDKVMTGENEDLYAALADIDLRDLGWMPLDVIRLRDSGMAAKASGDEFMAAVLLWAAAWHQAPAASLPDDDRELARLAGYGRAVDAWQAVRDMALYGFERGPDGRLYHPVIAEKALEAVECLSKKASKKAGVKERVRRHRAKLEEEKAAARAAGEAGKADQSCNADVTRYSNAPVTPCNASTLPKQTLPESPPLSPPRGKRKRGLPLPDEWEPDEACKAFAVELGLDVDKTLERFRDEVRGAIGAKAKSDDWSARWRNWCRGSPDRRARSSARRGICDPTDYIGRDEDKQWRARMKGQRPGERNGIWQWGPRPGEAGCEVPPHILREFGFKAASH
ncbi:DUF1376 domain-containing protein [Nisaea nitritireducens]|uniref:DUF1376 domain-containing protein n=1 Tax=Nisaea nitritireducens TaxID=568392 RepID=UPI001D00FA6D|nr:DUF1376 domain-containing protein [Nisaea nitritireducens]